MGFALTLFGVGVLLFVVGRYLILGHSVPGFPFLASIIAIFSGAQLFALGVIGEYLARMHFRLMARPPYSVRSIISRDDTKGVPTQDRKEESPTDRFSKPQNIQIRKSGK
jgi:undecaprenyl-phosphate 4-deoxy-4-formamido-L-arabinose transferase